MKKVIIIRHGKAEHPEYEIKDFDRGLTNRGFSDATLVAQWLESKLTDSRTYLSSPAKRAYQTVLQFTEVLEESTPEVRQEQSLYDGLTTTDFLDLLATLPDDFSEVLLFGHNPTLSLLAERLCLDFRGYLPTSALVALSFPVESWSDIEARSGEFSYYITPKEIKEGKA